MRLSILLLLVMLVLSSCSTRSSSSPSRTDARTLELRAKLKTVTVSDGISKSEAELITECYFHKHVGCGNFEEIRDGGDFWIVEGNFGKAADPIVDFHIDNTNGKITSPIGPNYASPFEIFP